jgi:hypothetical protein
MVQHDKSHHKPFSLPKTIASHVFRKLLPLIAAPAILVSIDQISSSRFCRRIEHSMKYHGVSPFRSRRHLDRTEGCLPKMKRSLTPSTHDTSWLLVLDQVVSGENPAWVIIRSFSSRLYEKCVCVWLERESASSYISRDISTTINNQQPCIVPIAAFFKAAV